MMTISTTMKQAVLAGLVSLALSTAARADADAMRCDATKLRKEAKCADCKASCDDRFGSAAKRADADGLENCKTNCDTKYAKAVVRLNQRPICTPETACPLCCEAELLRAEAREMLCKARCGVEDEDCANDCVTTYHEQVDAILASSICAETADPRITPEPVEDPTEEPTPEPESTPEATEVTE